VFIIHFHALTSIRWFLLPCLIAQYTVTGHNKTGGLLLRVGLALACDFYGGNGKGIHNVEIPPVRMSVCPAFGQKQLNECP
jgi:hypothetical protein